MTKEELTERMSFSTNTWEFFIEKKLTGYTIIITYTNDEYVEYNRSNLTKKEATKLKNTVNDQTDVWFKPGKGYYQPRHLDPKYWTVFKCGEAIEVNPDPNQLHLFN